MLFVARLGGFLAYLVGKTDLPIKTARIVGAVALVALGLSALLISKAVYDHRLIARHEAAQRAETAEATVRADRDADKATAGAEAAFDASQDRLSRAAVEAARRDPVGAGQPVGPVSRSYYDNLPEN